MITSVLEGLLDRATKVIDSAVLWQLGNMPVPPPSAAEIDAVEPKAFWDASRVHDPAPVSVVREYERRQGGRVRVVDLEGPSRGPGLHPGSRKLIARAHLREDLDDAPVVLILHGFAVPITWYEEAQCRLLTKRGAHAIRLDHPFHLRRRQRGTKSGEGYMNADPERLRMSMRQSVEDAAALVAWARQELSSSVSVLGVSLGGGAATLLAALIELQSVVAVAPFCDPAATLLHQLPTRIRHELGISGDSYGPWGQDLDGAMTALSGAFAPITARNFTPPATPAERITLIRPDNDLIVGIEPINELAATWGSELWDVRHGHISVMRARGLTRRMHERLLERTGSSVPDEVRLAG